MTSKRGVIIFTEKNAEMSARQTLERDVAFSASTISGSFVASLFDSYRLHKQNMPWQRKSAIAKIAQFESLTRIARNRATETLLAGYTTKKVAIPYARTINPTSNNFSALKRNRRFTSFTVSLFGPGLWDGDCVTLLIYTECLNRTRTLRLQEF
jgi:hypothetical protein